jgi:hypothetical protein
MSSYSYVFAKFTIEHADTKELFAQVVITTTDDDRLRLDARVKCEYDCELLYDIIHNPQDYPEFNVYEQS